MRDGLEMRPRAMTAEGDRVAAEVESYGVNPDGTVYNNDCHVLLVIRDRKLVQVKKYLGTQHTYAVFLEKR